MNTRFSKLYLVCLSAMSAMAHAEVTQLDEIVVTAARIAQPAREVVGDVTVISAAEIQNQGADNLPQLLARQPGVQITSNGGAGKAGSVFIRGANANQTVVLIDGIRYGSATTGAAALQHLPLAQIERIEILRGPAASLYGADAIGGVIQIFTKTGRQGLQPSVEVGYGTQNTVEASANLAGGTEQTRFSLGLAHNKTDGVSALVLPKYQKYNSDDDGYENTSLALNLQHQLLAGHSVGGSVLLAKSENHYDNAYTVKSYDYRDTSTNGSATIWTKNQFTERWTSKLQAGLSLDDSYNYAPAKTPALEESRFKTQQNQLSWQNDLQAGPGVLSLALETLQQKVSGTTRYDVSERRINSVLGGYLAHLGDVTLQANLRSDDNSQFDRQTTGTLGGAWHANDQLQLGASYGTGYQAPTFNQLYYPGWSNPNLKPQESEGGEVFARWSMNQFNFSVTAYQNEVKDFILTKQNTVKNVEKVQLRGVTITGGWANDWLEAGFSYDYLDAQDQKTEQQLELRAKHSGLIYAGLKRTDWSARVEVQAQGLRYDDVYGAGRVPLAGYALTNLSASYQLNKDWSLHARVNNLFDKDYTQVYDYSTVGLNGMLSVRWAPK